MNSVTSLFNSRFSYCVMILTTFLFAAFYLHTFYYLILALLLTLPVFSYNLTKYAFSRIEPTVFFSHSAVIKKPDGSLSTKTAAGRGEECTLEIIINNHSGLPISCFEITISMDSLFYGSSGSKVHSLQLKPGINRLSFPVKLDKYGVYTAKISAPAAYDYLHLFSLKREFSAECSISVMPDAGPSGKIHEAIYEEGFDEFTDNTRRGNVSSNVTDIREYQPGDRLSRIHWKLTEKLDKLIVKENEATSSNEFTVLLELYQPSKEECDRSYAESDNTDESMYHVLDDAIEEAWSVSVELLQTGTAFMFMFYDHAGEEFTTQLIGSSEELEDIFTRAFYAGSYDTKDLALSVYERSGMNRGTLLHVG